MIDAHFITDVAGFAIILLTFIWRMGRVEFKIDLMWRDYSKRHGLNGHAHGD